MGLASHFGVFMSAACLMLGAAGANAAGRSGAADAVRPAQASRCDRGQFRVLIDVGHTVEAPGAESARGIPEFGFNRVLADEIVQRLVRAGFTRTVLLVTEGPAREGLALRVARANQAGPDLFLSIHHDSVPDQLLQDWTYDGKPLRFSDRFRGHSIFVSIDNSQYGASLLFARFIGNELRARGLHYTPHYIERIMGNRRRELVDVEAGVYRYDQLIVLRTTQMPAVLLEAGSIVNRDEELELLSPQHQAVIGAAVTNAVDQYCEVVKPLAKPLRSATPPTAARPTRHLAADQPGRTATHR